MADGIGSRFDGVAYPAANERLLDATLMMNGGAGQGRPGVRPGISSLITVGGSPEAVTIAPHNGVIVDSAGGGTFRYHIPSAVSINLAARPSAGQSRIDEVVVVVKNVDVRPADLVREVDLQVLTGTPSAGTPSAPTIPTGAFKVAELSVPASGTVSVNIAAQRMVALGGILPVASQAERDAVANIYDGLTVYREDTDVCEQRQNGAWERLAVAGRGGTPYAQAAGTATISGSSVVPGGFANVTISFPAGRFTQAPLVEVHLNGFVTNTSQVVAKFADQITTTGARLQVANVSAGTVSWTSLPVMWRAVQMTAASAAG